MYCINFEIMGGRGANTLKEMAIKFVAGLTATSVKCSCCVLCADRDREAERQRDRERERERDRQRETERDETWNNQHCRKRAEQAGE